MNTKDYGTKELERDYGPLTFGKALLAHRKCEEISQKDFAEKLGVSQQSLCDIEKGRRIPSAHRAVRIARKIGQPENLWVKLALQDELRKEDLNYIVTLAPCEIEEAETV